MATKEEEKAEKIKGKLGTFKDITINKIKEILKKEGTTPQDTKLQEAEIKTQKAEQRTAGEQREAAKEEKKEAKQKGKVKRFLKGTGKVAGFPFVVGGKTIARGSKKLASGISSGNTFIFLAFVLYVLDLKPVPFNGIGIKHIINIATNPSSLLNLVMFFRVLLPIIIAVVVTKLVIGNMKGKETLWFFAVVGLSVLLFALGDVNVGFILHWIFIIGYLVLFEIPRFEDDRSQAYKRAFLLLFFDFIGFSIIEYLTGSSLATGPGSELVKAIGNYMSSRQLFPVLFLYTTIVSQRIKPHWFKVFLIFFIFFFGAVITIGEGSATKGLVDIKTQLTERGRTTRPGEGAAKLEEKSKTFWEVITGKIKKTYNESIAYATGDYYTGKVDNNVKEPLGVNIIDIDTADPEVYEDEPIEIWGTLKAKSIEEPIETIEIECKADAGTTKEKIGKVKVKEFRNFIDDEEDIDCTFEEGDLEQGSHSVTFSAEFDFTTLAYLKSYFIDNERLRALKREDIDVFDQYGIKDKNPIAIYTNGPVGIGMETKTPPIGISNDYDNTPKLGITVENRWTGEIKEIKDLYIYLPEGITLEDNCDNAFELVRTDENSLEGYNSYKLVDAVKESKKWRDIETYRSRNCRMNIERTLSILGETPIAVKYIKSRIEYIYNSEESFSINVLTPKGFNVYFDPKRPTLNDDIKCVASHSDLYVVRAPFEIYINDEDTPEKQTVECGSSNKKCDLPITTKLKRGDKIKCKVYKAKLSNEEEESDTAVTTIKNSPPKITTYFKPDKPSENDDLICLGVIEDKDDSEFKVTYEVKNNNERIDYDHLDVKWIDKTQFQITIDKEALKKNDKISCVMTAFDVPPAEYESKQSESDEVNVIIQQAATTTTTETETDDFCSKEENDKKSCGGSTYKICYQKACISQCDYLVKTNDPRVSSDWGCRCDMTVWSKTACEDSNKCLVGQCPGSNYCCSQDATP